MLDLDRHKIVSYSQKWAFVHACHILITLILSQLSVIVKSHFSYILLFLSAFLANSALCNESPTNILILLSNNDDVYLDVATTITNATIKYCRNYNISCQNSTFDIVQISSYNDQLQRNYQLIVTLGIQAALFTQKHHIDKPTISALIPKSNQLIASSIDKNPLQYYQFLDQPIERSLLLINTLTERFNNIGVILSRDDKITKKNVKAAVKKYNMTLYIEEIGPENSVGTSLNTLLDEIDIILALPDANIHNKSTVSYILLSSYRKRIPLIGFSSAYVKAGALAAVYSSPQDIAYQTRDSIVRHFLGNPIPKQQQMDKYFSVLFNSDVARSLDFPIKSETKLKKIMMDHIKK
jgi:ABC-type uncharacterized transport system substrate-binding protein